MSKQAKLTDTGGAGTRCLDIFKLCNGLAERAVKNLHAKMSETEGLFFKVFIACFFAKAYKSYQAVNELWALGFHEDALILSRTIYEIQLQVQYMNADPEARAERFLRLAQRQSFARRVSMGQAGDGDLERILQQQGLEGLLQVKRTTGFRLTCPAVETEQEEELDRSLDELAQDFRKYERGWWDDTVKGLAEKLGKTDFHQHFYALSSQFVHTDPVALGFYRREVGNTLFFLCRPREEVAGQDLLLLPGLCSQFFIGIIKVLDAVMLLHLSADIEVVDRRVKHSIKTLVEELEESSG